MPTRTAEGQSRWPEDQLLKWWVGGVVRRPRQDPGLQVGHALRHGVAAAWATAGHGLIRPQILHRLPVSILEETVGSGD